MSKFFAVLIPLLMIGGIIFFSCTLTGVGMWNSWFHEVKKVDDQTSYDTRKHVEDFCRTMIVSYTSDSMTYEQYKDSDNEEKRSWAEQAKMRANKTASSYNEYVLKNSYVWEGNIPPDVHGNLPYLE